MIKGKGGRNLVKAITSEDGKPVAPPEAPEIPSEFPKSIRDVILCDGRVFEVHSAWINYLADLPYVLPGRIQMTIDAGMGFMYRDGGYGCHYCNHNANNVAKVFSREGAPAAIIGDFAAGHCRYEEQSVKWAKPVTHSKNGGAFMALARPCVVDEMKIRALVEKGLLNDFEVQGREFEFPTLEQLASPEVQARYRVIPPGGESRRSVSGMLGYLRRLFRF